MSVTFASLHTETGGLIQQRDVSFQRQHRTSALTQFRVSNGKGIVAWMAWSKCKSQFIVFSWDGKEGEW